MAQQFPFWRGVAPPDFSSSIAGIQTAGNFMNQGFRAASDLLETTDSSISKRVNNALLAQIAGIDKSEGAEGQIKALMASADPRRLNTETIMFGADRPNSLIARDKSRFDLETGRYNQNRIQERNAALDASESLRMELVDAYRRNDSESVSRITGELGKIPNLRASDYMEAITGGQGVRSGDLGIQSAELGLERSRYGFGREKLNDAENDAGASTLASLRQNGIVSVEAAREAVNGMGLSPKVYNAVMAQIDPMSFVSFDGAGGGGGLPDMSGGNAGDASLRVMNYEARNKGFAAVPDSVRTLGQASEYAKQVNRAGVSSSAMGVYQIVGTTLRSYAPKVLGEGWQNADYNFENQDKIARAVFEDNNGSADALRKQWVSLSASEAEQIRKLPWEEARQVIARKESRGDPRALALTSRAGAVGRAQALDTVTGDPSVEGWSSNIGKANSIVSVAGRLTGKEGVFAGADQKLVEQRIREVQAKAAVMGAKAGKPLVLNPDQAAAILENSVGERTWGDFFGDKNPLTGPSSIGGRSIDNDALTANINRIISGGGERMKLGQVRAGVIANESAAAEQAVAQQAAYVQQLEKKGANPEILAKERGKLAMLQQSVQWMVSQQMDEGDLRTFGRSSQTPLPKLAPVNISERLSTAGPRSWNGAIPLPARPANSRAAKTKSPSELLKEYTRNFRK